MRDRQAQDALERARAVGFEEIAFQYEPIAAALDFESTLDREQLVLVADIGGGIVGLLAGARGSTAPPAASAGR